MEKVIAPSKTIATSNYDLHLTPKYAIVMYLNSSNLDTNILQEVRNHLKEYYQGVEFVLINQRTDTKIDPKYYRSALSNMKGVAVVAPFENIREDLVEEQKNWSRSFAVFNDLEEAKHWALHSF